MPMLGNLNGWHAVILLVLILLLFGAPKIPALARSVGQAMHIFKTEIRPEAASARSDGPPADQARSRGLVSSPETMAVASENTR